MVWLRIFHTPKRLQAPPEFEALCYKYVLQQFACDIAWELDGQCHLQQRQPRPGQVLSLDHNLELCRTILS